MEKQIEVLQAQVVELQNQIEVMNTALTSFSKLQSSHTVSLATCVDRVEKLVRAINKALATYGKKIEV